MMNSDMKWFVLLIVMMVGMPMIGLGLQQANTANCRLELGKSGRTAEDIKEICK